MSQAQDDHISISSVGSSDTSDAEKFSGIEIPEAGPSTFNVEVSDSQNLNVGPQNNYYAPVTHNIYLTKDDLNKNEINVIEKDETKSENVNLRFKSNAEVIQIPDLEKIIVLGKETPGILLQKFVYHTKSTIFLIK